MKAVAIPTSKSVRSLVIAAAIAVAALSVFGSAQHVSADGNNNNTITFTEPADANHISFVTPATTSQTALTAPNATPTGITLTSPVAVTSTNADTGPTASAGAPGN